LIKLRKYLKPFLWALLLAILLLFAQALCELNLPNYMSRIVNVGIQQSGVENAAPDNISTDGYALMGTLMDQQGQSLLAANYTPGDKTINGKDVYVLKANLPKATLTDLNKQFGLATWTMVNLLSTINPTAGGAGQGSGSLSTTGIDKAQLQKIYQMIPMLQHLPAGVMDAARQKAAKLGDSYLAQSGIVMTKAFYTELGIDMGKYQTNYIIRVGLFMLLIALASGVAVIIVTLLSARIAAGVARNLRNDIFTKVESFSHVEFDRFSSASLITRTTNDVLQIQTLLAIGIRMLIYSPILAIGGIIMALQKSVSMSWIIVVACLAVTGVIAVILVIAVPKFKALQKLIDRINLITREGLNGLLVIRAFRNEEHEKQRFDVANKNLTSTYLFVNRAMTFMMPIMMLIMNGISVLIIWVGAHQVAKATMQVGDMMAFMQYAIMIIFSFLMISMMFVFLPRAAVAAERIAEVLETEPAIVDPASPKHIAVGRRGHVEFKNVSFSYEEAEEPAIEHISFMASPGETTAFIGATGSGKSTLLNLIPRFYDATHGEVLVDGVNVKDMSMKELRSHIGYIPQESILMGGSIESNIRYGNPDLDDKEMMELAEIAQAMEFVRTSENGFNADISQGGSNISGGQKQRLSIARALAVKPDIYLFDDSFSALDFKTDAALRKALNAYIKGATVLIVAQRVNTIMDADQIYVLDDGKIVGHGTHRELLTSCPEYFEIASSQLSAEELEERGGHNGK
jgi:ATP-binding cassette, subfamily B, multidrug efflux pump